MSDFDQGIEQAWAQYRRTLGTKLDALQKGESFVSRLPYEPHNCDADCVPRLVFSVTGANRVRCSVPPLCNASRWRPHTTLTSLGFKDRQSGWYVLELGRRFTDKLAAHAVHLLREIWNVQHPSFLDAAPDEPDVHLAVVPRDADHLLSLVIASIADLTGEEVESDSAGGLAFSNFGTPWYVRILAEEACVEFTTNLDAPTDDLTHVARVLTAVSAYWPDINMMLHRNGCFAVMRLDTTTFVAKNFESTLRKWSEFLCQGAPRIRDEMGGAESKELAPEDSFPPALEQLMQLEVDQVENVDAAQVAEICGNDPDTITHFLEICSEQISEWWLGAREAHARGQSAEAAACRRECNSWSHTASRLRAARRFVIAP